MKTAVIYARQSFGVEEGSASIEVQIENCKRWAKRNNAEVLGVFKDANCSSELYPACEAGIESARCDKGFQAWKRQQLTKGRKEYKEGLGQAFDYIRSHKPDFIVVNTENRLGRSATNSNLKNFITAFFMENNCSVVDASSNSVMDFSDRLMMAFRQMKDALDYIGVEEKRRSSMESVAKRIDSHRVWSNAYGVEMQNGIVTFDKSKAEVVKMMFDGVVQGRTYNSILNQLNTQYRSLANGKQWYQSNIYNILGNIVYCGYSKDTKGEIGKAINIPEPIVSYSEWSQVQKLMDERRKGYKAFNVRGSNRKHFLPFSGYLFCECGRRLVMENDNGVVYHCINGGKHTTRIRMNSECDGQDFVKSMQSLLILHAIDSRRQLASLKDVASKVNAIKASLDKAQEGLKAKMRMVQTDEDYEMLKDVISESKQTIAELKSQLAIESEKQTVNAKEVEDEVDEEFAVIMSGNLNCDEYMRLVKLTIERIEVRKDSVKVLLKDGNAFELPRLKLDNRGKKAIPSSQIYAYAKSPETLEILHYEIVFGKGSKETVLVDAEDYTITLRS